MNCLVGKYALVQTSGDIPKICQIVLSEGDYLLVSWLSATTGKPTYQTVVPFSCVCDTDTQKSEKNSWYFFDTHEEMRNGVLRILGKV